MFRGQTLNLKARRIFLRGPGDFNCPPPRPSRLILPAGMSKLSKLTGNALPIRRTYTSGQKRRRAHLGLFPQTTLPKTVMRSHDTIYTFLVYSGSIMAGGRRLRYFAFNRHNAESGRQPFSGVDFSRGWHAHIDRPAHPQRSVGSGGKFPPWPPDPG